MAVIIIVAAFFQTILNIIKTTPAFALGEDYDIKVVIKSDYNCGSMCQYETTIPVSSLVDTESFNTYIGNGTYWIHIRSNVNGDCGWRTDPTLGNRYFSRTCSVFFEKHNAGEWARTSYAINNKDFSYFYDSNGLISVPQDHDGKFNYTLELQNPNNSSQVYASKRGSSSSPIELSIQFEEATDSVYADDEDNPGGVEDVGDAEGEGNDNNNSNNEETSTPTCHSTAGALGWIICPILEFAASASVWAYNNVIEPSLVIRADLFDINGESNGAYQAWQSFRDIANIIFVIFLLIVIFSQVTGVGIDNYGIKKALPKLVVSAFLINLSFFICQALVDASNIAGAGAKSIIEGITISDPTITIEGGQTVAYATSICFTIAGLIAAGAVATAVHGSFWTMLGHAFLLVLPVFLSAVVAILFLFFLLALRQALVVMLVAVSPLAFACYFLPNTKRLFDRWVQLLRGMLVLYPICAVMVAGGRLASKIILLSSATENSLFFILIAMVAEAGPLFLIPGLTRSAYQATGQLGASLNRLRGRLGGVGGAVQRSQTYQRAAARNQRARLTAANGAAQRRVTRYNQAANRIANGNGTRMDRFHMRRGNQERVAAINQATLAADEEQRRIDQMSNATQVAGMRASAQISNAQATGRNQYLGGLNQVEVEAAVAAAQQEAATSAEQQNIHRANYGDAHFAGAVIEQARVESDSARDRQLLYGREEYRESRRRQNEAVISGEVTKMYSDQYSRMSISDLQERLRESVTDGGEHSRERFTASVDALARAGQVDKAREVLSGKGAYAGAADSFGDMVRSNEEFRNKAAQVLGSSGEFTFQEYAKHLGQEGASARSFKDWSDATDSKSLRASIQAKGLDRMDKDGFAYLAEHTAALSGASADNISKVAANTTDAATVAKLTQAIEQLDQATRQSVIASTSADRFANMDQSIRDALAGAKPATSTTPAVNPDDSLWRAQVGAMIRDNAQISARISEDARARYAAPGTPAPAP